MSRYVTERTINQADMALCAQRAYSLRERSKVASTSARSRMLKALGEAYGAYGVARAHTLYGSDETAASLVADGKALIRGIREEF